MLDITEVLESTLADGALSRGEGQALRQLVADHKHDRQTLARFRNTAFKVAEVHIAANPQGVLKWLGKVDKIIDNANRDDAAKPAIRRAFSPGDDGLSLVLSCIREARQRLDVCVFTITDDRVTAALLDAHRSGITVRVITDNDKSFDKGSDIYRLRDSGVPVRFDPTPNHMHHKFALIDGQAVLTGSYNWTRGATHNHENVIVIRDAATAEHFGDVFDALWREFA